MRKELTIGNIKIFPAVVLAPIAGYTDSVYRRICKRMGAGLVFTELVSADGILHNFDATRKYAEFTDEERPIVVQIFGSSPASMAEAASIVYRKFKPDIIDINLGCPAKKIVKKGAGASLLKDLDRALKIVSSVAEKVPIPVTVKTRKGWDNNTIIGKDFLIALEEAGVKAITIHSRTAKEGFSSPADWDFIKELKQTLNIPVIGNGSVKSPTDVERMFEYTGCDGVMIGRGALGNPWIFKQTKELLLTGKTETDITPVERVKMCIEHIKAYLHYHNPELVNKIIKKHIACYIKHIPEASKHRHALLNSRTLEQTLSLLTEITKNYNELSYSC